MYVYLVYVSVSVIHIHVYVITYYIRMHRKGRAKARRLGRPCIDGVGGVRAPRGTNDQEELREILLLIVSLFVTIEY